MRLEVLDLGLMRIRRSLGAAGSVRRRDRRWAATSHAPSARASPRVHVRHVGELRQPSLGRRATARSVASPCAGWIAAATSLIMAPVSWSDIHSCRLGGLQSPPPSASDPSEIRHAHSSGDYVGYVRKLERALIVGPGAHGHRRRADPPFDRSLGAAGRLLALSPLPTGGSPEARQDRGHRRQSRLPRYFQARIRPQCQPGHDVLGGDHPVRVGPISPDERRRSAAECLQRMLDVKRLVAEALGEVVWL